MTTTFADLGVPADLVSTLASARDPRPVRHPDRSPSPTARRPRPLRPGPDRLGQDARVRHPARRARRACRPRRARRGLVLVPDPRARRAGLRRARVARPRSASCASPPSTAAPASARSCKALRRGVDVVVACPGRLTDLIERGEVDLDAVEIVVVDEADRMADMGFLPAVQRLLDADAARPRRRCCSRRRSTATSTRSSRATSATRCATSCRSRRRTSRVPPTSSGASTATTGCELCRRRRQARRARRSCSARRKRGADRLRQAARPGRRARRGDPRRPSPGPARARARARSPRARSHALVATDVAARGIHVDGVACVVHFDPPNDAKDYIHRSGRTARAGDAGTVVSFVGNQQGREVAQLQQALGMPTGLERPDREALASLTPDAVNRRAPVKTTVKVAQPAASASFVAVSPSVRPPAQTPVTRRPGTAAPSSGSTPRRASASSSAPTATTSSCTSARSRAVSATVSPRVNWSTTRSAPVARAPRRRTSASSPPPLPDPPS